MQNSNVTLPTLNAGLPIYKLPEYFVNLTKYGTLGEMRFYKYTKNGKVTSRGSSPVNNIKLCNVTVKFKMNNEIDIRRWIEIRQYSDGQLLHLETFRVGFVYLDDKKYNVYIFPTNFVSSLTKWKNLITFPMGKEPNWTEIYAKKNSMAPFPEFEEPIVIPPPPQPISSIPHVKTQQATAQKSIPLFVANILIKAAVEKGELCPILCDPLTRNGSVVTTCFHIFSVEAFAEWRKKSMECPMCHEICNITYGTVDNI